MLTRVAVWLFSDAKPAHRKSPAFQHDQFSFVVFEAANQSEDFCKFFYECFVNRQYFCCMLSLHGGAKAWRVRRVSALTSYSSSIDVVVVFC